MWTLTETAQHFPSQFREASHKLGFRRHIAPVIFTSLLRSQIPLLVKRITPFRLFQIPTAVFNSITDVDITILDDVPSLFFQMDNRWWGIVYLSHHVHTFFSSPFFPLSAHFCSIRHHFINYLPLYSSHFPKQIRHEVQLFGPVHPSVDYHISVFLCNFLQHSRESARSFPHEPCSYRPQRVIIQGIVEQNGDVRVVVHPNMSRRMFSRALMKQILGDVNNGCIIVGRHLGEQIEQNPHFPQFLHEIVENYAAFSTTSVLTHKHLLQPSWKLDSHFLLCWEYVHNFNNLHICSGRGNVHQQTGQNLVFRRICTDKDINVIEVDIYNF